MSDRGSIVVRARHVWKSYDQGRVSVLQDASLEVRAGEVVALWGSSGSGKSTLLHLLGGLDTPDRGELSVCGLDPTLESNRLELRRRHLGFVFQLHNLIPDLTVEENIRIPALALGRPVAETAARVRDLATRVGLQHRQAAGKGLAEGADLAVDLRDLGVAHRARGVHREHQPSG